MGYTPLYALDIETDTDTGGLDPSKSRITAVAIASDAGLVVFDDDNEGRLLRGLAAWLRDPDTEPGCIVTWNGANFDMPFLNARAMICDTDLAMVLTASQNRPAKYQPMPGATGGFRATVAAFGSQVHDHVDICFAWKSHAEDRGITWSLKPVAGDLGIDMISVDREKVSDLTPTERAAYNLSDVNGTLELARATPRLLDYADSVWL